MTGLNISPGTHSVLWGLASRHALRRAAMRDALRLLGWPLLRQTKRLLAALFARLGDWSLLLLATVSGGAFVYAAAVYLLLMMPQDHAHQPDIARPIDLAEFGAANAPANGARPPLPTRCTLALSQTRHD